MTTPTEGTMTELDLKIQEAELNLRYEEAKLEEAGWLLIEDPQVDRGD